MSQNSRQLTRRKYIPGLDGLRAIAIVVIILYHMFPDTMRGGYLGVALFFVLSGYLLAVTCMRGYELRTYSVGRFYHKRIQRIYPALIVVLGATLFLLWLFYPASLRGLRGEVMSILLGYNNWRQISMNASYFTRIANTSPFTHLWSTAIELQYYLIWPVLFFICARLEKRHRGVGALVLFVLAMASITEMGAIYLPGGDPSRVYYGTDTRVHALLLGSAVGLLRLDEAEDGVPESTGWLLFGLCIPLIMALFVMVNGEEPAAYEGLIAASALAFALLIGLVADPKLPFGRWLDFKPVKWLGQISYELYLLMYPTIYFIQRWRPVDDAAILALIEAGVMLVLAALLHLAVRPAALKPWKGRSRWTALLRVAPWLMAAAVAAGAFALLHAPAGADDLEQLQAELAENAAHSGEAAPTPSGDWDGMFGPGGEDWPEATPVPSTDPATVTCVGDSVMLGALPALQQTMPGCVVDAKESRQAAEAIGILQNLDAQGKLGSVVVIALGTNGPFSVEFGQSVIDWLGPDRQVYWVTAYGATLRWQEESNSTIRAIAEQNDNVTLIDWAGIAPEHPEWFYSDGIHLQQAGQQGYADFVAREIGAIG